MNLIELNRALHQLRLGGMVATLETRLQQAQAESMAPIDLISTLVSDQLACRSKRLLDRRHKLGNCAHPKINILDLKTIASKPERSLLLRAIALLGQMRADLPVEDRTFADLVANTAAFPIGYLRGV